MLMHLLCRLVHGYLHDESDNSSDHGHNSHDGHSRSRVGALSINTEDVIAVKSGLTRLVELTSAVTAAHTAVNISLITILDTVATGSGDILDGEGDDLRIGTTGEDINHGLNESGAVAITKLDKLVVITSEDNSENATASIALDIGEVGSGTADGSAVELEVIVVSDLDSEGLSSMVDVLGLLSDVGDHLVVKKLTEVSEIGSRVDDSNSEDGGHAELLKLNLGDLHGLIVGSGSVVVVSTGVGDISGGGDRGGEETESNRALDSEGVEVTVHDKIGVDNLESDSRNSAITRKLGVGEGNTISSTIFDLLDELVGSIGGAVVVEVDGGVPVIVIIDIAEAGCREGEQNRRSIQCHRHDERVSHDVVI
jgi:hypothetical protein